MSLVCKGKFISVLLKCPTFTPVTLLMRKSKITTGLGIKKHKGVFCIPFIWVLWNSCQLLYCIILDTYQHDSLYHKMCVPKRASLQQVSESQMIFLSCLQGDNHSAVLLLTVYSQNPTCCIFQFDKQSGCVKSLL